MIKVNRLLGINAELIVRYNNPRPLSPYGCRVQAVKFALAFDAALDNGLKASGRRFNVHRYSLKRGDFRSFCRLGGLFRSRSYMYRRKLRHFRFNRRLVLLGVLVLDLDGLVFGFNHDALIAVERSPVGELVDIMDVGFACAFLATPYGRRLTGQTVYVDGGASIMA